jgi:prepilin-type processing-associated H-X9-DG protein
VPEEGNTIMPITAPENADAWYNSVAVYINVKALTNLYLGSDRNPPLPASRVIYSCPSAPNPDPKLGYANPPNAAKAYFMYGENSKICVNRSTRESGKGQQTRLSLLRKPCDTILVAEVDGNSADSKQLALSVVTGAYAIARHGQRGNFAMADGSSRAAKTNDFWRAKEESNSAKLEWSADRKMYWYPSDITPDY